MVTYTDSLESISASELYGFFDGWPNPPSPSVHLELLRNSYEVVLALDEQTGQVVGFVTAISDGVLSAYIPFLEVLPAYQDQGVGQELMRRMLEKLQGLYMVDLLCDSELQNYYAQFGMRTANGMMLRNYDRQSGPKCMKETR
jgi:ribosomal protein S18 acetylase RimI-like enzyme